MAATIAELRVPIKGDNSDLKRVFNESRSMMKSFASESGSVFNNAFAPAHSALQRLQTQSNSSFNGIGVSAVAMGNLVAGAVQSVASSITGMISSVVAGGFAFNSMKEQATVAFTNLLGSTDLAKEHLAELFDLANRTPFESEGIIKASQRLQAMGFEAKQVIPTLETVADAVAGVGGGADVLQGVITALGQIQSKGKASAEEMNQLAERGIPAWKFLADAIGKDIPTAMKLAEKGAISADVAISGILAGMKDKFGGLAAAQSKTWAGLLSTISDVSKQVFGELTGPLFEKARNAIASVADFLPKLIPLAQEIGIEFNKWIDIFEPMGREIFIFFQQLAKSLNDSKGGFQNFRDGAEMVANVLSGGVANGFRTMTAALQVADSWMKKIGGSVHDLMGFLNPLIGSLNLLGKIGGATGLAPDREGENLWKEYRKTMRETEKTITDMKRSLRDAFDPGDSPNKLIEAVKKVKQTISEMSPFITERAIAGSPEAVKGVVERFVDTLVNELNNNKDRVGEVGGSLASMFINRFESSLGGDKKNAFFQNIVDDLRELVPTIEKYENNIIETLKKTVAQYGVETEGIGLRSEATMRSIIDNLRQQVGLSDKIWKGFSASTRAALNDDFIAAAKDYINQLLLLEQKTQTSAVNQSISIQKLFAEWRKGVLTTEEFMARLSGRTAQLTVDVVRHVEEVAVATSSMADSVDKSFKKIQDSIDNSELFQTDRLASETKSAIESIISFYERYAEQLGLTGDAYDIFVNQKVRAATAEMRKLNKGAVDEVIKQYERLKVTLPGIWDEVFKGASNATRKNVDDILRIIDLIPGRTGEALRKTESEFRRWYEMIDRTIRLIERALGEKETEGLMGVIGGVAKAIGGIFKKAQAETKASAEDWSEDISSVLGGMSDKAGEAGGASGESFEGEFMKKVAAIAGGLATFFGSRGKGKAAGVLGGALAGAQIGAAFGGGLGAAIGAGAGAIAGLFGSGQSDEEKRAAEEERKRLVEEARLSLAKTYEDLKQSILTTARDFIKFVDEMAGSAQVPKDVLNKFINNMVRTLSKLADAMKSIAPKITAETQRASEQLLPAVELMSRMPLVFDAINQHMGLAEGQVDLYFQDFNIIAERIGVLAEETPNKLEKQIKKFSNRILPVAELLVTVSEGISAVIKTPPVSASQFQTWAGSISVILIEVGKLEKQFDGFAVRQAASFAQQAVKTTGFLKEGSEAIKSVGDIPTLTASDLVPFSTSVHSIITVITDLTKSVNSQMLVEARRFSEGAGASVTFILNSASAFKELEDMKEVMPGALLSVGEGIKLAITILAQIASEVDQQMRDDAQGLSASIGSVFKVITDAAQAFTAAANTRTMFPATMRAIGDGIQLAIVELARVSRSVDSEMVAEANSFAVSVGQVVNLIGQAGAAMRSLEGEKFTVDGLLMLIGNIEEATLRTIALAKSIDKNDLALAVEFAINAQKIFEATAAGIEIQKAMANLEPISISQWDNWVLNVSQQTSALARAVDSTHQGMLLSAEFRSNTDVIKDNVIGALSNILATANAAAGYLAGSANFNSLIAPAGLSASAFSSVGGSGQSSSAFSSVGGGQSFTNISTPAPFVSSGFASSSQPAQTVVHVHITVPVQGSLVVENQVNNRIQEALVEFFKRGIVKSGGNIQFA